MIGQNDNMMHETDVLCVGHASWDIFLYVDEFPRENSKQLLSESEETPGGPAANAAVLLSRWGLRCDFAGVVGNDPNGILIERSFIDEGVGTLALERRNGIQTALSTVVVHNTSGSRTILTRKRSSGEYQLPVSYTDIRKPCYILTDGHEPDAAIQAIRHFPEAVSVLDAGGFRTATLALASKVDYLIASERFAAGMLGTDRLENEQQVAAGLRALDRVSGGRTAVTLGEKGCAWIDKDVIRRIPGIQVNAVDTTAAGDIFHGAFVFALSRGKSFQDALEFANRAAALSVTRRGGQSSIPDLSELSSK